MAYQHCTYQFDWGYATFDRNTEGDRIAAIEAAGDYLGKFDVTIPERELIDDGSVKLETIDNELVITEVGN